MSAANENYLEFDRKIQVSSPSKAANEFMMIPVLDFQRIRRRLEEMQALEETQAQEPRRESLLPGISFALIGAAVAIGAAIPSLLAAKDLPSWVTPTYIVSAIACFLAGLALTRAAGSISSGQRGSITDLVEEMRRIDEIYGGKNTSMGVTGSSPENPAKT